MPGTFAADTALESVLEKSLLPPPFLVCLANQPMHKYLCLLVILYIYVPSARFATSCYVGR